LIKTFRKFLTDEMPVNNTGNVEGMRTEPVIRKKTQVKYFKRNIKRSPTIPCK